MTPHSRKSRLEVTEDGALKVWVTSPPADGQANAAVLDLLAKRLAVSKSSISIVKGETSREKVIQVEGLTEAEALARLTRDR